MGKTDKTIDEFIIQPEEVDKVKWIDLHELNDDVRRNPDKYVLSMTGILDLLT